MHRAQRRPHSDRTPVHPTPTPPAAGRHRLLPGVRVLRRETGCLQIGQGASHGLVVEGLDDEEMRFLESLQAHVARDVCRPERGAELVRMLVDAGLCAPAREHEAEHVLDVVVVGSGELRDHMRRALVYAGHRIVDADAAPSRVGLVVLTGTGGVPFVRAEHWRNAGVAHLPVAVDSREVRVGPLVRPPGPCLRCVDLWLTDADPAWPTLLAQIADTRSWSGLPATGADASRIALAVALAMREVHQLAYSKAHRAEGPPRTATGPASVSVVEPDWRTQRDTWPQHPRCPGHPLTSMPPEMSRRRRAETMKV